MFNGQALEDLPLKIGHVVSETSVINYNVRFVTSHKRQDPIYTAVGA